MELFSDRPGDQGLPGRQRAQAMIGVMLLTTMAVFDGTMINIALPHIARSLEVSTSAAIWVTNGYLLATVMTLAFFAALAARVGFRTQFTVGLVVFVLASAGCAAATSLPMLVAMRLLQGLGGAATLSIAPAIHRSIFPNRLLGRILGINALLIATCTAAAPLLAGAMLSLLDWRWLFAINVPLGLVALLMCMRVLPSHKSDTRAPFDVAGALWSALMLGAVIMAVEAISPSSAAVASQQQWLRAAGFAALAIISGVAFVRRQHRAPAPLLPLSLFSSMRFSLAALTSLASFVSQGITFVALPILFQSVYGYNALIAALLFIPWPLGIMLSAPHAGRLSDRHSPAQVSTVGLLIFSLGLIALALLPAEPSVWDIAARSLICGLGFGYFQSPNNREMLGNAPRELSSYASGVLSIVRTFGQCLGAACVGVALALLVSSSMTEQQSLPLQAQALHYSLWVAAIFSVAALLLSYSRIRRARQEVEVSDGASTAQSKP
ncbi:MFS transporter [Pokkaliibacter sp. MBI-7]|uniref:MFS transporter n=1 Tax=Pokkaliibacter sp. MBI-7 TaxID=3040600 RepID=UPI00244894D0|nr:MFS transporter [Pokkaliibacter sp. MBI-7]MDH2434637.1 MFS transporter [Pokkaliibacter sp. MBI-7]